MKQYIIRRLAISILVLFGVSIIVYALMRSTPGDYVGTITNGNPNITAEMKENLMRLYGLDKGIVEGYIGWLKEAIQGN
ncbi:MAG: diguanylate cyclase, partial [Cellulosilyticaceae bacterium]